MKEQHICTEFCFIRGKLHPETKPGFTVMTQAAPPKKKSSKWKCLSFAHKKQQSKSGETSTGCWQSFLAVKALFFISLSLYTK